MAKLQQDEDKASSGINLLISILVRYPEIGTINYDAKSSTLKLAFLLSGVTSNNGFNNMKAMLLNSIAAYHVLEETKESIVEISLSSCEQVALLSILRDVSTLSRGEIALIIGIIRDNFKDNLVVDENESLLEEELLVQEEVIGTMLESIKTQKNNHGLIGIREEGRVFVFNK